MDSTMLEDLLLPWWKVLIYLIVAIIGTIAIRVTFKVDVAQLLKEHKRNKLQKEQRKLSEKCRHGWTLYHDSVHSECNVCHVFITTAILLAARQAAEKKPHIIAEQWGVRLTATAGSLITADYLGADEGES